MHQRLQEADLLAIPLGEVADRAIEVDVELLREPLGVADVVDSAQAREESEVLAAGEPSRRGAGLHLAGTPTPDLRAVAVASRPNKDTLPDVGRMRSSSSRSVVVLPAPFGPR